MQFTKSAHDDIAEGRITVTYRAWKRPQAKVGGRHRVGAVQIEIDAIDFVPFATVTDREARAAGLADREALRKLIAHAHDVDDDTVVYRIAFHVVGDATVAPVAATDDAIAAARVRLDRLDARRGEAWTREYLALIGAQPGVVSTVLAEQVGRPRLDFKVDVRKLKAIGLTESLEVGYRLTPLGEAVVDR